MAAIISGLPSTSSVRPSELAELAHRLGQSGTRGPQETGPQENTFSDLMQGLLAKANEPHMQADQAFQQLATGQTDNVHDVVLSVVKADMSFRLVMELRNRLTEAYQEVMRMQV
jgi:flagellar hook-basal body complex protein FliE